MAQTEDERSRPHDSGPERVRKIGWALVFLMASAGMMLAGEPEDGWMQAIRSGAVKAAWVGVETGQIVSHGLEVRRDVGNEGVLTVAKADGQEVMTVKAPDPKYTGPQFIYGLVPDWQRSVARVEIVVEYFDAGPGKIDVQYNSTELPYAVTKTPIVLGGTNRWRVARLAILDAEFRKKGNGCDFRIFMDRQHFSVRTIAVVPLGDLDQRHAPVP